MQDQQTQPTPEPGADTARPEDRSQSFQADPGGGNVASGEVLLVQAYAVMWFLAFLLVLSSIRKQRQLDARISQLAGDLAKARDAKKGK